VTEKKAETNTKEEKSVGKTQQQESNPPPKESVRKKEGKSKNTKKNWIRIERGLLFPKASDKNPLRKVTTFRIVIGFGPARKWGNIEKSKSFKIGNQTFFEIRVQKKKIFKNAPSFNPLSKLELPAIRVLGPSALKALREYKKRQEENQKILSQSH